MTGGTGSDLFVFSSLKDSVSGSNRDVIADFSHAERDRIDLSDIDAMTGGKDDKFHFTKHGGADPFTHHKGELRYTFSAGDTIIQLDVNGDGRADSEIALDGKVHLVAADFML